MSIDATDPFALIVLLGTIAFAVSGGAAAVRAGMDWLGVVVLAIVTAVGGGTTREMLTGQLPVRWVHAPWPIWVALASGLLVIAVGHRMPRAALDSQTLVVVADAAGLAAFTVSGTLTSLSLGISGPVSVMLGVITGTGGGVIRDVLARERPLVLVGQIYAMASAAGAVMVVALTSAGAKGEAVRWAGIAVVLALRLAAIRWDWSLPRFRRGRPEPHDAH